MIGKTIGTYRIESLLSGKGGMGRVYLAHHIHLKTPAAIKVIHAHLTENEDFRERFRREALSLYQLVQHPGIVRFFDYIEDENAQYIITEYVEGDNLADYVKKNGALSVEKLQNVFRQVLDILGVVHQKGIIHRDLKPANIMLTPEGEVKLLDFGIAKISADNLTATGTSIGTVMYMSPERIYPTKDSSGKPLPLDVRSDIYSLGVSMYEAVCGRRPFDDRKLSTGELLRAVVEVRPDVPTMLRPDIPARLNTLVLRMLEKNPDERPSSMQAVAQEIENILREMRGEVVVPAAASSTPGLEKPEAHPSSLITTIDCPENEHNTVDMPSPPTVIPAVVAPADDAFQRETLDLPIEPR